MKDIKDRLQRYYKELMEIIDTEDSPKLLNKRHNRFRKKEDQELLTGVIVVFLVVTILLSMGYYFIVFAPQQEELDNIKQDRINRVNTLLPPDDNINKLAIISEIESKNSVEELQQLDVDGMIYPILKNSLLDQLNEYRDKYDRVELATGNSTDIMNINNAADYINTRDAATLSTLTVRQVDSVIIPLSINRKQAASGLITEGNVVDIYKISVQENREATVDNTSQSDSYSTDSAAKIVGGCHVVSILRSKDSGTVDENIDLTTSSDNRNFTQSATLDLEQIMSSKAAGTYNESQIKVLLDGYGTRLADYERTSRIGDLDVEYIIMLEVPRSAVESLLDNMDNIILTIPTYDAPSWVRL